jgi:hypothetical protein
MRSLFIFKLSLVLLLLALITACRQVPIVQPAASEPDQTGSVAPQEEAKPIVGERVVTSDSTFYAANPELMAVRRYTAAIEEEPMSASTFYAANPELMAAERYCADK